MLVWAIWDEEAGFNAVAIGFGVFLLSLVADGLRRGVIDAQYPFDRTEHPGLFGFFVVFYSVAALCMFGVVFLLGAVLDKGLVA